MLLLYQILFVAFFTAQKDHPMKFSKTYVFSCIVGCAFFFASNTALAQCLAPANVDTFNTTSNSVLVQWSGVSGALQYQYIVTTTATPPAIPSAGSTLTTDTFALITSLPPNTNFCFHVRSLCTSDTSAFHPCVWIKTGLINSVFDMNDNANKVNIYPNPATNSINVVVPSGRKGSVSIASMNGSVIKNIVVSDPVTPVNIESLPAGVYVVKFVNVQLFEAVRLIKK